MASERRRTTGGRRALRATVAGLVLSLPVLPAAADGVPAGSPPPALAGGATSGRVDLPTPEAARTTANDLLTSIGAPADRLLPSRVPGPVVDDEVVRVGVGGDGSVRTVALDQRLRLTGTGDYTVRERGPARSAVALNGQPPPVTRRGAVVWQGFSPGARDLAARLVLDPGLEAVRLPLRMAVSFVPAGGGPTRALPDGGVLPGAGTVTVGLAVTTAQPAQLATAADAPAAALAGPLDSARAAARVQDGRHLPVTGKGLPASVPATGPGRRAATQDVPLRVTGTLRVDAAATGPAPQVQVTGPATTPVPGGVALAGTTAGTVSFALRTSGPGRLVVDLRAVPVLDPRTLVPPRGLPTWAAWAASRPPAAERRAALDLLVDVAATGARAASYGPYLGAELAGTGTTAFVVSLADAPAVEAGRPVLHPRPVPIALTGAGMLGVLVLAGAVWRRS